MTCDLDEVSEECKMGTEGGELGESERLAAMGKWGRGRTEFIKTLGRECLSGSLH